MSKDPGYSDSKRDALESKVRQYQSTILELQEQVLVLGKLKDDNTKLKAIVMLASEACCYTEYEDACSLARQTLKELDENK